MRISKVFSETFGFENKNSNFLAIRRCVTNWVPENTNASRWLYYRKRIEDSSSRSKCYVFASTIFFTILFAFLLSSTCQMWISKQIFFSMWNNFIFVIYLWICKCLFIIWRQKMIRTTKYLYNIFMCIFIRGSVGVRVKDSSRL